MLIWPAPALGATAYARNGLDQYSAVGAATPTYDARGNLTGNGAAAYGYDALNRLTAAPGGAAITYDPMDRLYQLSVAGTGTRFVYDGAEVIGEYDAGGALLRRYVPGPTLDEPVVAYDGAGTSNRSWLLADPLGSVVAVTNGSGVATTINAYDEYGQGAAGNGGLFGYTGQMNLAATGLMHYRARAYDPSLGRFLQTDPILTAGGINLYAYVGNDPINATDPFGLRCIITKDTRFLPYGNCADDSSLAEFNTYRGVVDNPREGGDGGADNPAGEDEIVVPGQRPQRPAPAPPRLPPFLRLTPLGVFIWVLAPEDTAIDDCSQGGEGCRRVGRFLSTPREIEQQCRDECTWILERPYRWPGDDRNTFDYHRCVAACIDRNTLGR